MSVGVRSSSPATTLLLARGARGGVTRMPYSASAGCSSAQVTPGSITQMRLRRSTRRTRLRRVKSTMIVPGAPGTVSPWKCGGPELTGTSGVPLALAQATRRCTSCWLPGRTTSRGLMVAAKLSSRS